MDIIRRGTHPLDKPLEGECTVCETQIRFFPGEAKLMHDQRDGAYYEIQCPVCPEKIHVQAS